MRKKTEQSDRKSRPNQKGNPVGFIYTRDVCDEKTCPDCGGTGYDPLDGGQCDRCAGTGMVPRG